MTQTPNSPSACSACGCHPELYTHNQTGLVRISCCANDANYIESGEADDWCEEEIETGLFETANEAWSEWEKINGENYEKSVRNI